MTADWLIHRHQVASGYPVAHLYGPPRRLYGHQVRTTLCKAIEGREDALQPAPERVQRCEWCIERKRP